MPYGVSGVEIRTAVRKASAWNSAVACGASDGILIRPSSIKREAAVEVDDSMGSAFSRDGVPGPIKVGGDLLLYLRYDSLDVILAQVMGIAGIPVRQGSTAAYAYTYKFAPETDGKFVSFVKHMKNYVEEIPSLKLSGFTLKGEVGKSLELTISTIGVNALFDSAVNTLASFETVTFPEVANRVKFSEGLFRMNAQSGASLAPGDRIYPSAFELSVQRKLKGEYTGQYRHVSGPNIQDLVDEPTNDGPPEIGLTLSFPRHTGTTNLAILGGDTRQKMDIQFTGGLIAGSYYRTFGLQFPHLQLKKVDIADAEGSIREPLEFIVHGAASAPPGMAGITDPLWITGINQRPTDPLG
ncbi:MAG TPA: phage tail tube protein [Syntrophorhabdaceae bacterium]|jgi:hypothetical protein